MGARSRLATLLVSGPACSRRTGAPDRLADDGSRTIWSAVTDPGNVVIGADQNESRLVGRALAGIAVTDHRQRHTKRLRCLLEHGDRAILGAECQQREFAAHRLEHVSSIRQLSRWQMVAGPGLERVRAVRAADAARRPK